MSLKIQRVATSRDRKLFLNLPWQLYEGDPNWIPPVRIDQAELVNYKKHPFYDTAEIQTFLAYEDGRAVGRVGAIVNPAHNEKYDEKRGFVGFYESIDDQKVADGLFNAAKEWFAERDIHTMRGPTNPTMNYTCGLLVKGFDRPPTFMMTYNHEYYPKLWENFGFEKAQDLYAYWGHMDMLGDLDPKLKWVIEECKTRFKLSIRRLDRKKFRDEVRMFIEIYNKSLEGSWGFVPMGEEESEHMATGLQYLIVPEMTTIAEVEGKPVGAVFGLLDYNPIIKEINGSLFPFGFLRLLWGRKKIKRVRMISTNVLPEFQRWGVGLVLLSRLVPDAKEWGIQEGEFSWVLETNKLSRGSLERGGAERRQEYRIYDYAG